MSKQAAEKPKGAVRAEVGGSIWVVGMLVCAFGGGGLLASGQSPLASLPIAITGVAAIFAVLPSIATARIEYLNQVMRWHMAGLSALFAVLLPLTLSANAIGLSETQAHNIGLAAVLVLILVGSTAVAIMLTQEAVKAHQAERTQAERRELAQEIGKVIADQMSQSSSQSCSLRQRICGWREMRRSRVSASRPARGSGIASSG